MGGVGHDFVYPYVIVEANDCYIGQLCPSKVNVFREQLTNWNP